MLAEIAAAESERSLRDYAGERAAQLWTSAACREEDEEGHALDALSGIIKLGDQRALVEVAIKAALAAVRKRAFGELRDPKALAELAKADAPQDIRLAAVARIDDVDVLRAIAIDTTLKEVGLAAVDKIDDADRLENIATKAKNKAVRQRARKIVQEIQEAERAKQKPVVPDEVKRRRAEKAQLLREVEGVADTFDFERAVSVVENAKAAWAKLEADEGDERFGKCVDRFYKRKEIYEQQARSAEELRAIEREAQRERERAAAERAQPKNGDAAAAESDAAGGVPAGAAPAPDPAREAREAEAKARREEREKRKAEDDARRAEEQAAREAKRKEDAERGAAIATSLAAMADDMEKLAAEGSKDGRAIDRLLQQAGKAFEQIGKVPGEQRDALSTRYTNARGKLVVRSSELREAQDWQRFANVPKAEALIATAKDMLTEEPSPELGNRLRQLQGLWKEVGPMPQRRSKELWEQFKSLCDQVYDKVKGFRAVENEKFAEVAKAKEALIAEAESLADSTDWQNTANALKALQARWKESGHLPRKQGDELWKRFRAACDRFFERRKPELDARHAEEARNLAAKQALIARATSVANAAPGEGGWGKAIAEIKKLQQEWKEIGFVPRRDADAVYKAFRAACDSLFAKRDEARDSEANAHRAELDAVKAEIAAVHTADASDVVARAVAVRNKVRELDARELSPQLEEMLRHVVTAHPDAVKSTELDPAASRSRREKLIAKAEELLPKQPAAAAVSAGAAPADIAAQLKQAMRSNAFGDLRFSGRDPVEVVDELRAQWSEAGPVLEDADREQVTRFDDIVKRVLDAAGAAAKADTREERGERGERGRRRRDRDRRPAEQPVARDSGEQPVPQVTADEASVATAIPQSVHDAKTSPGGWSQPTLTAPGPITKPQPVVTPPTPAPVPKDEPNAHVIPRPADPSHPVPPVTTPDEAPTPPKRAEGAPEAPYPLSPSAAIATAVPTTANEAVTKPAAYPFEPLPPPPVPAEPERKKSTTLVPPMDDLDTGWDMGDEDPTASAKADADAAADNAMERPEVEAPPSSSEMAGDGAAGGDGIDEPGWD
ncbi:MAG: DUF349 domain-containing protein [Kofleriaceae bacterium]|nr:DUF349 domain-containing protein [Kofleriaceae bacterium]